MTNYHVENELRETVHRLFMTMITMRGLSRKMLSTNLRNSKLDAVIVYSENLCSVHAMTLDILEDLLVGEFDMYLDESGWCLIEPLQHDDYYMHAVSGHVQRQDDWIAEMAPDTEEDEETGYTQEELFDLAVERDTLIAVQWDAGTRRWVEWRSKAVAR